MPELPEVETVVRGLRRTIIGKTIERVRDKAPASMIEISKSFRASKLNTILRGRKFRSVSRRGKNILIDISGDITLWVHLKMTGHFFFLPTGDPIAKHDLVIFDFIPEKNKSGRADQYSFRTSDEAKVKSDLVARDLVPKNNKSGCAAGQLRYNDYRRFGRLRLYPNDELWRQPGLALLGPEPLELSETDFVSMCLGSARMIKPALLDQTFIAGLGNIYADEALFASRIHPRRLLSSLSRAKLIELHGHIQRLLTMAISKMGTSVDSYSGVDGKPGSFQTYLKAYGREGDSCERCGTSVRREKISSRSAHFCPRCQRAR